MCLLQYLLITDIFLVCRSKDAESTTVHAQEEQVTDMHTCLLFGQPVQEKRRYRELR